MALVERVARLLEQNEVQYQVLPHREAFTAQEVAQATHVAGRQFAKVVVLREARESYVMAVLPASQHLDLDRMRHQTGRQGLLFADEAEIVKLFPDCEPGAMPPFGRIYGLPMYLDGCFWKEEEFYFQAGNHREVVRVRFKDYERLARPIAGNFCLHEALVGAKG